MAKRISKEITKKEDIDFLLNLDPNKIGQSTIMEMFGTFEEDKRRFNPYDIFTIPKGAYGKDRKNNKPVVTTVGRYIFNKCFIENSPTIFKQIGYYNESITKKNYGKLFNKLGYYLLEDKISLEDYKHFCNMSQAFMPFVSIISPGFTEAMLLSSKKIDAKKKQLLKENKAAIEAKDIIVADKIQKELLDYAKQELKDDPSMDMFNSETLGSFENNFKNMFVMRGTVRDPDPTKGYNIITSNYIDGITADEYPVLANTLAEGPYNRSKKTEVGGYWEKLLVAGLQHVKLLPKGTDCGTKKYITVNVTEGNISSLMYCYVIEGDKLVEITSDNMNKYIGKKVKLRYSSMCKAKDGICNMCAGNAFYRQGRINVGMESPQVASKIKNIFMKSFHDSQIKLYEMNPMKAFGIEE